MTIAHSSVKVEQIYTPFLEPERIKYLTIKPLQSRIPYQPFVPAYSPPSNQSNFLRSVNILAKSCPIFTKFPGKLPVGVPQWLKQKTNKSINRQTNKQTNKSTIF